MKKCPYCAEKIQDEAIVCRYCGRDLPKESILPTEIKKEPSVGTGALFAVMLLVSIYGIGFLLIYTWKGSIPDLQTAIGLYQIVSMFLVTLLAVQGLNPEKRGFLRSLGVFILSVIPIVGWIVIYWAGKGLARRVGWENYGKVLFVLVVIVGLILLVAFTNWGASLSLSVNPTSILYPTSTQYPMPTVFPTSTVYQIPYPDNLQSCIPWNQVDNNSRVICVYGEIQDIVLVGGYDPTTGTDDPYFTRFVFDKADPRAFVVNYDSLGVSSIKVGDCLIAKGSVSFDNRGVSHLFMTATSISLCH